jgi:cytochrome c5
MSDAHADHDLPHEGPIKTPRQLIWAVVLSFVVPIIAIILLVNYVTSNSKPAAGSDSMTAEAIAQRLQRVGQVRVKNPNDPSTMLTGEQVYAAQCSTCHAAGAVGAPKFGDEAAWAPRIKTGYAALLNSALKGKGNMAAQGGGDYADLEVGRAVVYMANKVGAKFEAPKLPAAAEAPAAAATPAAPAPTAAAPMPAAPAPAAAPAAVTAKAEGGAPPALFNQVCVACHGAGVAGAPKVGDKAAWAPRLAAGVDGLTASVLKGKGAMPPKGGAAAASEADIKAVVAYFVAAAK